MIEILREKFLAHYYQIALVDHEDPEAYPEWETGEEPAIASSKGIVVATPIDGYVETIIMNGEGTVHGVEVFSGTIEVGQAGLCVGNEVSASYQVIPWPAGKTNVIAYLISGVENETSVVFILNS